MIYDSSLRGWDGSDPEGRPCGSTALGTRRNSREGTGAAGPWNNKMLEISPGGRDAWVWAYGSGLGAAAGGVEPAGRQGVVAWRAERLEVALLERELRVDGAVDDVVDDG